MTFVRAVTLWGSVFLSANLFAQTFLGNLSGIVTDSSAAVLAGAAVRLENPATGLTREVTTSANGGLLFADLPVGSYTLTVSATGFQTKRISDIEVAVSKITNITVALAVAQQQTIVEVTATSVFTETTSSALVGVVNTATIQDLPLNARDFRQLIKLVPGTSPLNTSINGMRTTGSNYQIDGADNNDAFQNVAAVNQGGVSGIPGTLLPVEAIDQFSIQSNGGPEQGRNGGAQVNVVLKSGTNDFHGSAFYYNRNEALANRSPILSPTSPKQVIRNNQFGFSAGGPIIKDKTFFFLAGESQLAIANNSILTTEPSAAWVSQAQTVLDRYGVPLNPVSTNLLTIWPSNVRTGPATTNNYLSNAQNNYKSYNGVIKIDHRFNDRHSIFARYFGGTGTQTADLGSHILDFFQVVPSHMHNFSVVETALFSPQLVNQVTFGVNYFLQTFNDRNTGINPVALGLNTTTTQPAPPGSPKLTINGFDFVSASSPQSRIDTTGHVTDSLTYVTGTHTLNIGGEYRRAVLDIAYDINKRGTFTFDGSRGPWATDTSISSNLRSLADFLAGEPSNSNGATIAQGQLQRLYYQNSFDLWAGDTYRVHPRLVLNYGVRYTYHGVLHDSDQSLTNFIPGQGFVTPNRGSGPLYPKDFNNFAPRVGFAWTPSNNTKTVIRGSFGVFYDVPALNFFTANISLPNGGAAGINANPAGANPVYALSVKNVVFAPGVPIFGATSPTPPYGVFSVSQNFRTPYVENYNLNIQRQLSGSTLLQVGYVGNVGRKLPVLLDINQPVVTNGVAVRPFTAQFPQLGTINNAQSVANSSYNSLQISLRQNSWKGISGTLSYTYGHAIDNTSDVRNTVPTNSYDLGFQRGSSTFDVRHTLTSFISYDLPKFTNFAPRLTGGWQLNSLFTASSGTPINILAGTNVSGTGENQDRVNLIGDPFANVPVLTNTTAVQYFNPAAFARPAAGTFGTIGRNVLYGPGFGSVDFSVFKQTRITERVSVQFRAEIFNLFNRTNWANPNVTFSSASFGQLTQTRNGGSAPGLGFGEPRNTQLALRLLW